MKRSTDGKTLERSNVFNLDIRAQKRGTQRNEQYRERISGFFNYPALQCKNKWVFREIKLIPESSQAIHR